MSQSKVRNKKHFYQFLSSSSEQLYVAWTISLYVWSLDSCRGETVETQSLLFFFIIATDLQVVTFSVYFKHKPKSTMFFYLVVDSWFFVGVSSESVHFHSNFHTKLFGILFKQYRHHNLVSGVYIMSSIKMCHSTDSKVV